MALKNSTADEDLALELGAKLVRTDGSIFNAGGRVGVTRLPINKAPVPVTPPVPQPPPQDNSAMLQVLQLMVEKMQPQPTPEFNIPAPVVTVQPAQRVLDWTFDFSRNPDGTIKSIRARATQE
jgi:hypothetical protein